MSTIIQFPPIGGGGGSSTPTEYNAGNSGASITLDFNNGTNQFLTLTANCNITLTNPTVGQMYTLVLEQDAAGNRVPSFTNNNINYAGNITPTWASSAYNYDVLSIYYDGAGYAVVKDGPFVDNRYFSPTQVANCELFVITTIPSTLPSASNGVAQTTWIDSSANALTFSQTTAAAKPIYYASGLGTKSAPYLSFNGSSQYMQTTGNEPASLTGNASFTIFVVFQGANTTQDQAICGWGDGSAAGGGLGLYGPTGGNYQVSSGGGTTNAAVYSSPSNVALNLMTATKSAGAYTSSTALRINGVAQTLSAGGSGTPNITAAKPFCVGTWANYTTVDFNGKIAAYLVYSRVLTSAEITKVENYLNAQIGVF